jgi:NO-binding membrane sensor protein with MHYT domain
MPLDVAYSPFLVLSSLAVAIMGAFAALRLTSNLRFLSAARRKSRVAQGAIALGVGIWSMHFVGMLAVDLPLPISYDPLRTLGSALIAILTTGSALLFLHFGTRTRVRIVCAGVLTGMGIVAMHYLGMSAISANCLVSYSQPGVLLATAIGIAASIAAMELAYSRRSLGSAIVGSVVLGMAISAMHYTAMIYTSFSIAPDAVMTTAPLLDTDQLALIVALASFAVSGVFLLSAAPNDIGVPAEALPQSGQTRRSIALSRAMGNAIENSAATREMKIPYERDKTIRFLPIGAIRAVKADGHYTWLYDGKEELFCPWSISRVEKYLAEGDFIRTHRSFIVNSAQINGFRRDGDKAYCIVGSGEGIF